MICVGLVIGEPGVSTRYRLSIGSTVQGLGNRMIAGPNLEGTVMTGQTDMREMPQAKQVVSQFRAQGYEPMGYTLYAYAAVQVWAQAVAVANSLKLVTVAMHRAQFDTVSGRIRFDERGDVVGFDPWQWYV